METIVHRDTKPANSRVGLLRGEARPTAALRRQIRTLYGDAGCRDMRRILSDCYDVSLLGNAIARELPYATSDRDLARRLTPRSGLLLRGDVLAHAYDAVIREDAPENPYAIAEHVIKAWREQDFGFDRLDCSLGDTTETNVLKIIFNNTTWANVGDATGIVGSGTAGSLYVQTETANPG